MGQAGTVPSPEEDIQNTFARIEEALDQGQVDLSKLGFWRLLGRIKVDPGLSEHWADRAGRIDRRAFEAGVKLRFPVWLGNLVLLVETLFGAACVVVALNATSGTVAGIALVVAGGTWVASLHCLGHWVVGRLVGIRFTSYFLRRATSAPGLKTDYATYLRADPGARAWMHASGAIVSKVAPFAALVFAPASNAPAWAAWALVGLGLFTIATDVLFSRKTSDWKKVIRERRVARARVAALRT